MRILFSALETIIASGIIWAAIMVFKKFAGSRLSAQGHLLLWLLFFLRLAVPVTIDSPVRFVSVPGLVEHTTSEAVPFYTETFSHDSGSWQEVKTTELDSVSRTAPEETRPWRTMSPDALFIIVWSTGAALAGIWALRAYFTTRRKTLRESARVPSWLQALYDETCRAAGVKNNPRLLVVRHGDPGLLFPDIVFVPARLLEEDSVQVRLTLLHEIMHAKRKDPWLLLVSVIVRVLNWYNPFVWLAFGTVRTDIEAACDSEVAEIVGAKGKPVYARMLLAAAGGRSGSMSLNLMGRGAKQSMARRIHSIFRGARGSSGKVRASVCLLSALLGFTCFTNACSLVPVSERTAGEYLPCSYVSTAHVDLSADPSTILSVTADMNLQMPEVPALSAVRVRGRDLTEQEAQRLIEKIVGSHVDLYTPLAAADSQQLTHYISSLRDAGETVESGSVSIGMDTYTRKELQAMIDAAQSELENAPQPSDPVSASTAYSPVQPMAFPDESERTVPGFHAWFETSEGTGMVAANQCGIEGTGGAFGLYMAQFWITESAVDTSVDFLRTQEEKIDPGDNYTLRRHEEYAQPWYNRKELMDSCKIDLADAQASAIRLLEELDVVDVQIRTCEKAIFQYNPDMEDYLCTDGEVFPGSYVEFVRENAGVPCVDFGPSFNDSTAEQGYMLLDSRGNPVVFQWVNMSETVSTINPNVEVLPFEEAASSVVEQLIQTELPQWDASVLPDTHVNFVCADASLVMMYAGKDDGEEDSVIEPAYLFTFEQTQTDTKTKESWSSGTCRVLIDAVRGEEVDWSSI